MLRADESDPDVLRDRGGEEPWFLRNKCHLLAQPAKIQLLDIMSVEQDIPRDRAVEAFEESDDGAFAGSRWSDKGCGFAGWDIDAQVVRDDDLGPRRVDVADILQNDVSTDMVQGDARVE